MQRTFESRRTWTRWTAAVLVVLVGTLCLPMDRAGAAGITTHGWMAVTAIDQVQDPALHALLDAHREQVRAGASFPDVGYVAPNTYGEEAHWQRFVDNYLNRIAARPDCGDLTEPDGPCADEIAHLFGVAAHGMGDEVWDWLFEPNGPDLDEYWTDPGVPTANDGGAETQMDLVAIGRYGVPRPVTPPLPDPAMLIGAFDDSGLPGITTAQFALVPSLPVLWDVEKSWSDAHLADVEAAMPWMSANLVTAPGGVDFAATAIAGYWSSLWGRLNGDQPATRVSITYPAPGQQGIPATGWDRANFDPGSGHGRGGARNRITAVLTSARPYVPGSGGAAVSQTLPEGGMTITDLTTGEPVSLKDGYPRSVPYGNSAGEHVIDVQPAGDLAECTTYRVDVGVDTPVVDSRQQTVTPYSWTFRTECADDPPPTTPPSTDTPPTAPDDPTVVDVPVARPVRVATPVDATPTYVG
jgi:hypothetical protein